VDAEGAGYVPRNNSPRMGFSGFFSLLDYILLTNQSEVGGGIPIHYEKNIDHGEFQ
jgi:hypothetical protein